MPPRRRTDTHTGVSADKILAVAARLIETDGAEALTMRTLAEQLNVAVTSIYWHIGGRDMILDRLVERLLGELAHLPADGDTPVERIASLARSQRRVLITRQHLLGVAHERDRTPELFMPIQQALAAHLSDLGLTGPHAALPLRAIQVHVISSAVMQFSAVRSGKHEEEDPALWADAWPDRPLVHALQAPTDYDAVFEYTLEALLSPLRSHRTEPKACLPPE